jgi:nucleotide-binding universal stress UspA family protein
MVRILLAVDGSESSVRATRKLVEMLPLYRDAPTIDLVTIHRPLNYLGGMAGVVLTREMVQAYYDEEGEGALAPCAKVLADAGVAFSKHVLVGEIAQTIARHAHESGCTMIFMGTRGMGAISNFMVGSVATKVLHLADVPVVLTR